MELRKKEEEMATNIKGEQNLKTDSVTKPNALDKATLGGNESKKAKHKLDDYVESLEENSDELYHQTKDLLHKTQQTIKPYSETLANKIKKNPLKSAAIAGAMGLLLGRLFR